MRTFGQWICNETWDNVFEVSSCDAMAQSFENKLSDKYKEHFPQKTVVHKQNDKPWMNGTVRRLIDQRNSAYRSGNMMLYRPLRNKVTFEINQAKQNFYSKNVEGLKKTQPGKWHKSIRNITGHKNKSGNFNLPSLGSSTTEQADKLNDHFSDVCCQLPPLSLESLPSYLPALPPPTIHVWEVENRLSELNASKAGHPDDIPIKIIKEFSFELAEPLTKIFNASLQEGVFPAVWKTASIIPVPKVKNPASANELRPIALTKILGRVFESFLSEWLKDDFTPVLDNKQYGNVKGTSTTHYLVDMLYNVISGIDKPSKYATLVAVDFTKAFDRINHSVAVNKIISSGVRPSIIPTISSFLSDRTQCVKHKGQLSGLKNITCGVPQGTKLGPAIFTVMVNDAAESTSDRWKFVDDLTLAEVINAKTNSHQLQYHLDALADWCNVNDMLPKPSKCHVLHVNFLQNPVQLPQLSLDGEDLQVVDHMKLLGVEIQNNLGWDIQVKNMISRASKRLFILYVLRKYGAPAEDLLAVFQTYIRPILEYACAVWHSALTKHQTHQIERIQKRICKIILAEEYQSYEAALQHLKITSLEDRRKDMVLKFGQQVLSSERHRHLLPDQRSRAYNLRRSNTFPEPLCKTNRLQNSTIPYVIKLLNDDC